MERVIVTWMSRYPKLHVDDIEDFIVIYYMASDLKTLKCMYIFSRGGNSKTACLYCIALEKQLNHVYQDKSPNKKPLTSNWCLFLINIINYITYLHTP